MANLILASKREVKSGAQMWHVYQHENGAKVAESEFYFALPYKALRYAFMLRKRTGAIIPKAIYTKLMADVSASKAQAEPSAESESAPQAEQVSEPSARTSPHKWQVSHITPSTHTCPSWCVQVRESPFAMSLPK